MAIDNNSAIDVELQQLKTLANFLFELPSPDGYWENFFGGMAWMIQGCADRIEKLCFNKESSSVEVSNV
jgi:hypothetical protein